MPPIFLPLPVVPLSYSSRLVPLYPAFMVDLSAPLEKTAVTFVQHFPVLSVIALSDEH